MVARYWRSGLLDVYRSLNKGAFVESLQRLVPEVREDDFLSTEAPESEPRQ